MNAASVQRIANRHLIRLAAREVCAGRPFRTRTAALHDLSPEVLAAFAEGFLMPTTGRVAFGGLAKKLKKLLDLFRKAPKLWGRIKDFLGITGITDIPRAIKDWAKRGLSALKKLLKKATEVFPLSLFFVHQSKMPGLTDLMHRIMTLHPGIAKALSKIKGAAVHIDKWFNKYLPTLKRPLLAAVFIWVWLNVAELSWDMEGLLQGFTGGISFGELLASLPESGIGFIAALAGLGYGALPVTIVLRVMWLVAQKYLKWVPGKGLVVNWEVISPGKGLRPEMVAVF